MGEQGRAQGEVDIGMELASITDLFLGVIEARNRSDQVLATLKMLRYGLTPREREVWMLRPSGRSSQEITDALYISVDTVKRRLKNSYAKRQEGLANHN